MTLLVMAIFLIVLLAYPYGIYPLLLAMATRKESREPGQQQDQLPSVSILLSLYNEENVVAEKIDNVLGLDYLEERLELIVISDGSSDRTEEIVKMRECSRVKLIIQGREGKTAALNRAAALSCADILVFTDANTFFQPGALRRLVAPFADPCVGLVSGRVIPQGPETGEGLFGRFETFLKGRESRLGIIAGADGAIYALRRSLYYPLLPHVINDFYHPIAVGLVGYRCLMVEDALALESSGDNIGREFNRQKRMANQALGIIREVLPMLLAKGSFLKIWVLISHKLLRWLHIPLFLALFFCSAWYLAVTGSPVLLMPQLMYLLIFICGRFVGRTARLPFVIDFVYRFQVVHLAYFCGMIDCLRGRGAVIWNPRGGA